MKREMLALQKLGERLTHESPSVIQRMQLSPDMLAGLEEAKRIKSLNALRRHYRRLGKLLREEDLETIQGVIDEVDNRHQASTVKFHQLEQWRENLLSGGSEAFGEFLDEYPQTDRQHLRQLIQAAQRERENEKSGGAFRKLFQYLREVAAI